VDAAQLRLVRLLAAPDDNLVVVGDDDQPYVPRNSHPQGPRLRSPSSGESQSGQLPFPDTRSPSTAHLHAADPGSAALSQNVPGGFRASGGRAAQVRRTRPDEPQGQGHVRREDIEPPEYKHGGT
jgi:hypothetical protein